MSFRLVDNQDQAQHMGSVASGAKRKVWWVEGIPPQLEVQCLALGMRAQGAAFDLLKEFMGCTGPLRKSLEPSLWLCLYGWAVWRASPGNGHMIGSGPGENDLFLSSNWLNPLVSWSNYASLWRCTYSLFLKSHLFPAGASLLGVMAFPDISSWPWRKVDELKPKCTRAPKELLCLTPSVSHSYATG